MVMSGTEKMLRDRGHDVAVMAMRYPDNIESSWQRYFPAEVSFGGGVSAMWRAFNRMMGRGDVVECCERLLNDFAPDVVHLHNIHSYLSPVVARLAHERGCRVVWTLHDYKLVCPSYSMLLNGVPCERCLTDANAVVKERCMKGSLVAGIAARIESLRWNRRVLEAVTDAFVCPGNFMREMMIKGGFSADKLYVLHNFIDEERASLIKESKPSVQRGSHCCYVGRLSHEKGVDTLLDAVKSMPDIHLKVVGGGALEQTYRERYGKCRNIEFSGQCTPVEAVKHVMSARCMVIPSVWYENNPLSVIEALCAGTPVVGAHIGGIPELIDVTSGVTFTAGDVKSLSEALSGAMARDWDNASISTAALAKFGIENHYRRLMAIYSAHSILTGE